MISICTTHLEDVARTGSSRSSRQWSQLPVLIWPRLAIYNFPKCFPKAVTEKGVEYRIDTAVRVCQDMTGYLDHYRRWCQWIDVQ